MSDLDFVLSKRIYEAHYDGELIEAFIEGPRRRGKSGYALKVAYNFYRKMGHNEEEAWELALKSLKFKLEDIIQTLSDQTEKEYTGKHEDRIPILIWDDVGIHANKYRYFNHQRECELLKGLMDVLGTCVTGFLMTCPGHMGTLKFLHEYDDNIVRIIKTDSDNGRRAVGYQKYYLPSGQSRVAKDFEDDFNRMIPDYIYNRYNPERERLARDVLKEIRNTIKQLYGADSKAPGMGEGVA